MNLRKSAGRWVGDGTVVIRQGLFLLWFWAVSQAIAQAPGVVIEEWVNQEQHSALLKKALALRDSGELTPGEKLKEQFKNPEPALIRTSPPHTAPLDPTLLARRAREIRLWIMALYICPKCRNWHLQDFAAAYAVAPDVLVTCEHAFSERMGRQPKEGFKESYLLVRDSQHRLFGVKSILAVNSVMDAALLRVDPPHLIPVPLNDQLAPGDPVFCYSDPLGQTGYFSDGILNRFYWSPGRRGSPDSLEQLSYLRVNFGTDWAPGSSGAPILDQCGNVAGHVSSIQALSRPQPDVQMTQNKSEEKNQKQPVANFNPPLITIHEGIPARGVMALIRDVNDRADVDPPKPTALVKDPSISPRHESSEAP